VDPLLLRGAFRIGFLILALALLILPFEDRASAEFVATVLAIIVGFIFVAIVTVLARSTLPPSSRPARQNSVDKAPVKHYNDPDSRSGGNR
jgi:predicted MFS family arabinose efflux permease